MKISEIKENILPDLIPSRSEIERINEIIAKLKNKLKSEAEKLGITYNKIEAQGSTGIKQTNLSGTSDIDIFIMLDPKNYPKLFTLEKKEKKKYISALFKDYSLNWIKNSLTKAGCSNIKLSYAEHPYISASFENYLIDIAGCFDLTLFYLKNNGPITAIDRTPHHSKFINENLSNDEKNEVRLLKSFFKSAKIYGDKSYIDKMGFTGFACEVLIYHYKNIENVFDILIKSDKIVVDFFNRNHDLITSNQKFEHQPIIIIDPTDPERNVTASINEKIYSYSKYWIKKFQDNPKQEFFVDKPIEIKSNEEFEHYLDKIVFIEFDIINNEVHYTLIRDKLYVFAEKILGSLQKPQYKDIKDYFYCIFYDNAHASIIYYFKNGRCFEKEYLKMGPPLKLESSLRDFKLKNPNTFEKNGRAWAHLKRKYHNAIDFIKLILKNEDLKYFKLLQVGKTPNSNLSRKNLTFLINRLLPFHFDDNPIKK